MTDTFRAMCAELVDDLELCDWPYKLKGTIRADIERARALLAEPVGEGVLPLKGRPDFIAGYREGLADRRRIIECEEAERPAAQPVAEGPSADELIGLALRREPWATWLRSGGCLESAHCELADLLLAVLARWGHPAAAPVAMLPDDALIIEPAEHTLLVPVAQPVPVSERLPRPEDCLDEGWAWFFNQRIGWRQAVLPVSAGYTHWLPANALPTPEAAND